VSESARNRYHDGSVLLVVAGVLALASLAGPWHIHRTTVYLEREAIGERTESYHLLWGEVSDRVPEGDRSDRVPLAALATSSWTGAFPAAFILVAIGSHALIFAGARGMRESRPGGAPSGRSVSLALFGFLILMAAVGTVLGAIWNLEGTPVGGRPGESHGHVEWWSPGPAVFLCAVAIALAFCGARSMNRAHRANDSECTEITLQLAGIAPPIATSSLRRLARQDSHPGPTSI